MYWLRVLVGNQSASDEQTQNENNTNKPYKNVLYFILKQNNIMNSTFFYNFHAFANTSPH